MPIHKFKIKRKDMIIVAFIFLMFFSFCYSYKDQERKGVIENEGFVLLNYKGIMSLVSSGGFDPDASFEETEKIKNSLNSYDNIHHTATNALSKEDFKTYNLNMARLCLLQSLYTYELYDSHMEESDVDHKLYKDYKQKADSLFKKVGLHQDEYYFLVENAIYDVPSDLIQEYPGNVLRASVYYEQYKKNLAPLSAHSADSMSSVMHIFEKLFPYFLILITCIICLDMISDDKQNGTIKLYLTQPVKRYRYLLDLVKKYFLRSLFMVFIPVIIVFIVFGIRDGFKTIDAPVLAYEKGITSIDSIDNNITAIKTVYDEDREIYFSNVRINPANPEDMEPQLELNIIPFWKMLFIAAIYSMVMILFYISLNLLFHVIFRNPIVSAACFAFVAIVGTAISSPENAVFTYNSVNPFCFRNPVYAITGYIGYSCLYSIIIVAAYIIVINLISFVIFKRKDIKG